jgi:endonuclease/exonuclease/phosphatase family metal-dependent hydrolase
VQLRNSTKTNQTGHLFVSRSLLAHIERCSVHNETPAWAISDHWPLSRDLAM